MMSGGDVGGCTEEVREVFGAAEMEMSEEESREVVKRMDTMISGAVEERGEESVEDVSGQMGQNGSGELWESASGDGIGDLMRGVGDLSEAVNGVVNPHLVAVLEKIKIVKEEPLDDVAMEETDGNEENRPLNLEELVLAQLDDSSRAQLVDADESKREALAYLLCAAMGSHDAAVGEKKAPSKRRSEVDTLRILKNPQFAKTQGKKKLGERTCRAKNEVVLAAASPSLPSPAKGAKSKAKAATSAKDTKRALTDSTAAAGTPQPPGKKKTKKSGGAGGVAPPPPSPPPSIPATVASGLFPTALAVSGVTSGPGAAATGGAALSPGGTTARGAASALTSRPVVLPIAPAPLAPAPAIHGSVAAAAVGASPAQLVAPLDPQEAFRGVLRRFEQKMGAEHWTDLEDKNFIPGIIPSVIRGKLLTPDVILPKKDFDDAIALAPNVDHLQPAYFPQPHRDQYFSILGAYEKKLTAMFANKGVLSPSGELPAGFVPRVQLLPMVVYDE